MGRVLLVEIATHRVRHDVLPRGRSFDSVYSRDGPSLDDCGSHKCLRISISHVLEF